MCVFFPLINSAVPCYSGTGGLKDQGKRTGFEDITQSAVAEPKQGLSL